MTRRADCVHCGASFAECRERLIDGRGPCCYGPDPSDGMREYHPLVDDWIPTRTKLFANPAWLVRVEHIVDGEVGRAELTDVEMNALRTHVFGRGGDHNPWDRALKKLRLALGRLP